MVNNKLVFDRIPASPPKIQPLENSSRRPLWSVMISAYNCIAYLERAIRSVLVQDPGAADMQIEVVDDCSTDGDLAALVQQVGQGRVGYYRQEINCGSLRNFETCINRSKGIYVHILHGDDLVKPGYYQEIKMLFDTYPQAGASFTNNNFINKTDVNLFIKETLAHKPQILENFLLKIAKWQLLEPAAITVKRSVYEHLGGFYAVHYGEDWEMWTRIAANYPVAYSPKCLASYRVLDEANITQKSYLTSQNVRDMSKVIDIIQTYLPPNQRKKLKQTALKRYSVYFAQVANTLYPAQKAAAFMQAKEAWHMHKNVKALYYIVKLYFKKFIGYKGKL
ncbi:glycosyltransferase family 2 protein [Mucilaginibacter sp.]|uniref:glycosyltransferase family 2 protein n=1 Tax=Mucilaginibacter sp. TaxID=1882438 RepID=UPI003AFFB66C